MANRYANASALLKGKKKKKCFGWFACSDKCELAFIMQFSVVKCQLTMHDLAFRINFLRTSSEVSYFEQLSCNVSCGVCVNHALVCKIEMCEKAPTKLVELKIGVQGECCDKLIS